MKDAKTIYNFLKPSLEQLNSEEKDSLCGLISDRYVPQLKKVKKVKRDEVHSVAYYKKKLLQTVFNKKKN